MKLKVSSVKDFRNVPKGWAMVVFAPTDGSITHGDMSLITDGTDIYQKLKPAFKKKRIKVGNCIRFVRHNNPRYLLFMREKDSVYPKFEELEDQVSRSLISFKRKVQEKKICIVCSHGVGETVGVLLPEIFEKTNHIIVLRGM